MLEIGKRVRDEELEIVEEKKLRVWWMPQVPMEAFYVPVNSVKEAKKILEVLANYDQFQLDNKVKPDYCNAGGLEVFEDGEWVDWSNEDGDDIDLVDENGKSVY